MRAPVRFVTFHDAWGASTEQKVWADAHASICAEAVLNGETDRAILHARRHAALVALRDEFRQQARDLARVSS